MNLTVRGKYRAAGSKRYIHSTFGLISTVIFAQNHPLIYQNGLKYPC